ncbi:MAG TPA: 3-deoxy-7-phosphoheptulonate synthase, partial [Candidatus Cloacimonadota bacterium]|nr:3-deoxy-7-phosphoheptulonate synthase [Candidatus Cloacimonadota bacterium]
MMIDIDFKNSFNVIAGPCAIESYDSLYEIANFLKGLGVAIIRGGSFKLRTSPNSFQGLGEEAIKYLVQVCKELGLASLTEVVEVKDLQNVFQDIDILMVGARNMYNYPLLKELSTVN